MPDTAKTDAARNLRRISSAELFDRVTARDREEKLAPDYMTKWLFIDRLITRGKQKQMSFYDYRGPQHVLRFMKWIDHYEFADWFPQLTEPLVAASKQRDLDCLARLGLEPGELDLDTIARYNAQDYLLQRAYPMPERMAPRTILDFGAGHGRQANLAFHDGDKVTDTLIAIDGIPSSYLTQRAYYEGLGLRLADYIEYRDEDRPFDVSALRGDHDVLHLPTWRFDLVPDQSVDLAIAVQVLREIPRRLVVHVLSELGRVIKPGGALYIRDHTRHDPNQMPMETLLLANGFALEFAPQVKDRVELHGLPRIWRKIDPELYLEPDDAE